MLGDVSSVGTSWATRNVQVLTVFGPLLMVTGVLGFLLPPELSLMSGAAPYNVFHLLAGLVAVLIVVWRQVRASIGFNLVFGGIDLWQAVAGATGHVVHVVVGACLVGVGWLGRREGR